jgi:hypothetical protein
MDSDSFRLALAIVAVIVAAIDEVRAGGSSLTAWGVIALGVAVATAWWPEG